MYHRLQPGQGILKVAPPLLPAQDERLKDEPVVRQAHHERVLDLTKSGLRTWCQPGRPARQSQHQPIIPTANAGAIPPNPCIIPTTNPYVILTANPYVIPTAGRNLKILRVVKGRHFRFLPAVGMTQQDT